MSHRYTLDMADAIDAQLGELSQFHDAFGFYVHGLSIKTGWCVEAHDLAASKLVAFREKDREFVRVLIVENLIRPATLRRRLGALPNRPQVTERLQKAIDGWIDGVTTDIASRP